MAGRVERDLNGFGSDLLAGEGPVRALMRRCDWAKTPLGHPEIWPQSLRAVVRVMLTSRFAMWMAWGPELTFLCNDAYLPTVGLKRDWVIGSRSDKVWEEIWPDIGPRIAHVLQSGEATWDEGLRLYLERSGFTEETYHTFSYSPLADDLGVTRGMLCVVAEETDRVIGERQLGALRELGARLAAASTRAQVMESVEDCLRDSVDLPFALAFLGEREQRYAKLAAIHGLTPDHALASGQLCLDEATSPLGRLNKERAVEAPLDAALVADLPLRFWQKPPNRALISPIRSAEGGAPVGYFVAGLNPHRALDGKYLGFVELLTAQVAAAVARADEFERERERARALAEIDSAKTAFFSNVSHEFRTPLTLMLGPLQDALDEAEGLTPRQRERLDVAHRNALRLLRLVNGLLDFSRIEAGRVQVRYQPTDLAAFTAELAASFRSLIERAGLRLRIDTPALSQPAYVDRDLWEKIVLNLLSNAFKFTFEGEIAVEMTEVGESARLVVRDTGIGVAQAELPRLFERFHRVEGAKGRSFEGSGIGLALVQELVKLHGGEIEAQSELGRGTAFVITLPLGAAHLPAERIVAEDGGGPGGARAFVEEASRWLPGEGAEEAIFDAGPAAPVSPGRERPRVLLADDNADLRGYIARLLSERGYEITAVADGEAALAAAQAARPDIVVTDVMMPKLDGVGLLRALRADPLLRDLPVIMLSARAGEEAKVEGLDAGADDYLTKPFSARELLARVSSNVAMARLRREAAEAVRASEAQARVQSERVQLALDAGAIVGVWERDLRTNRAVGDERFARAFGFDAERLRAGVSLADVIARIHEGDRARVRRQIEETLHQGKRYSSEYRVLQADGSYRWFEAVGRVERDENNALARIVGLLIDIDHRRRAEEELRCLNEELEARIERAIAARETAEAALRQSQKMEAVGQLTGGVAHDFNNLLTIISGNIDMASRALDKGNSVRVSQALGHAQKGAERAASLTQRLLAFSRRQPLTPKSLDAAQLTTGMSELLKRALGETISLQIRSQPGLWRVEADPNQLENAILNLAVNARDAMPQGGEVRIETLNRTLDSGLGEAGPGDYVVISVTDTGFGMDAETLGRAFDPFFTTKEVGKGTGLGLSMVYGFVRQSGGHVEIRSAPGEGATVQILLPRRDGEEEAADAEPEAAARGAKRAHAILVVEDDADVRAYTVEIVRELGYRVYEAPDGPAALRLLEGAGAKVDLLFTDVVMPGMSGRELAARARAKWPALKVLLTSGYTGVFNGQNESWAAGVEMIAKPFTYEGLARRIADLVEDA